MFLMRRRPPRSTRTDTLFPYTTLFRSASVSHTVIEVNGRDRNGLLYDLTRALAALKVQISSAKVSTFGERAIDVFYVKDRFGLKIDDEARLDVIRSALKEAPKIGRAHV